MVRVHASLLALACLAALNGCQGVPTSFQSTITVQSAMYGRKVAGNPNNPATCPFVGVGCDTAKTDCSLAGASTFVANTCNGKPTCTFLVNNAFFSNQDPCYGTCKYLDVTYTCAGDPTPRVTRACEYDRITLDCSDVVPLPSCDFSLNKKCAGTPNPVSIQLTPIQTTGRTRIRVDGAVTNIVMQPYQNIRGVEFRVKDKFMCNGVVMTANDLQLVKGTDGKPLVEVAALSGKCQLPTQCTKPFGCFLEWGSGMQTANLMPEGGEVTRYGGKCRTGIREAFFPASCLQCSAQSGKDSQRHASSEKNCDDATGKTCPALRNRFDALVLLGNCNTPVHNDNKNKGKVSKGQDSRNNYYNRPPAECVQQFTFWIESKNPVCPNLSVDMFRGEDWYVHLTNTGRDGKYESDIAQPLVCAGSNVPGCGIGKCHGKF